MIYEYNVAMIYCFVPTNLKETPHTVWDIHRHARVHDVNVLREASDNAPRGGCVKEEKGGAQHSSQHERVHDLRRAPAPEPREEVGQEGAQPYNIDAKQTTQNNILPSQKKLR